MNYTEAFAGWQLMRPYNKNRLLTKKVEKSGKIALSFRYNKDAVVNEGKN